MQDFLNFWNANFYSIVIFGIFCFIIRLILRWIKDNMFLQSNDWFIILDWKFKAGKTRFMTNLQKDATEYINIGNFWTWYTHIRFNSMNDLINLLLDIQELSEYQNYDIEDIKIIYKAEWLNAINNKLESRKKLNKYKHIPHDGYYTKFLWCCDEFQNLFFSRNALSNFSGANKVLLKLLHQVRHMNSLFVFATQNADELDIKFRRLSTFYVNTWRKANDWLYWYDVYFFANNSIGRKMDESEMTKINKAPIIKINKYKLNNIIIKINHFFLNLKRKYKFLKLFKIKFVFDELQFNTKFNCNPDYDIYKPWYIFEFLNDFYKEQKKKNNIDKINYNI